ncbi:hypothetical protein HOB10_01220 [Candidatus Parcubacteria bacterium]|jgi:hypothetical protein|nr:hypothetical protein [Candidatus Parcubacteria bacterium]
MDKDKKKKIIWGTIILLVILGLLLWLLKGSDLIRKPGDQGLTNEGIEIPIPSANIQYDPDLPPAQTNTEFDVVNLAKNFAERFGSWSTDNPGKNLEELLPLSTIRMQGYLQGIEIDYNPSEFLGLSTKSLSAEILSVSDSDAEVLVGTQRVENDRNVYYQDIKMILIKPDNEWLVDGAYWQDAL